MKSYAIGLALILSLGLHAAFFLTSPHGTSSSQGGPSPEAASEPSADEASALAAFEALDDQRAVEATMAEVVAQIPEVDFSDIKVPVAEAPPPKPEAKPKPQPKPKPKTKPAKAERNPAPKPNQPSGNSAKGQGQGGANGTPNGNGNSGSGTAGSGKAALAEAKANYNDAIRNAIARQRIDLPRGVRLNRVEVFLEFSNGHLAKYGISQSSGDRRVDSAILRAVKTARYPELPSAQGTINYVLPIQLQ